MLLMKRLRDDSAERLGFIDRKNIVIFDGPEDLFESIDYYLKNDKERDEITQAGYQITVERHTYIKRTLEMLDIIKNRFN